jgi:hypothetical protein
MWIGREVVFAESEEQRHGYGFTFGVRERGKEGRLGATGKQICPSAAEGGSYRGGNVVGMKA